ncbi:hypothetical protein MXB_2762 [Myxobolus squamalis]|nr:hypothetical protein MXB_2762 [Myxobolus squamalis]
MIFAMFYCQVNLFLLDRQVNLNQNLTHNKKLEDVNYLSVNCFESEDHNDSYGKESNYYDNCYETSIENSSFCMVDIN